jgi:glutathione synthase/RimK-type ligase-like ATP-grasp enzyme
MANPYAPAKPKADVAKIALLRRKEIGNNCHFISDNYPGMKIVTSEELNNDVVGSDWVIRWGTTTALNNKKLKVINKAQAISETSKKGSFRLKAHRAGLTPRTWTSLEDLQKEQNVAAVIVRPMTHERGKNIVLCKTLPELEAAIKKCGGEGNYYISDYIEKTQEFRVFVASGRAFMVFEKQPKDKKAVSWGCVEEGALKYVKWSEWNEAVVQNAIDAFNLSRLDFGAVDVIVKDGKAYFLEINTAPEVWNYYGECFALVLRHMIEKSRDRIPTVNNKGWKGLIHPAMTEKAELV